MELRKFVPYLLQCNFQFRNCFGLRFKFLKKLYASLPDIISPEDSNLESYVAIVRCQSFEDSWRAGTVERHVLALAREVPYASHFTEMHWVVLFRLALVRCSLQ